MQLGVPFSDPQADGPTIQATNQVRVSVQFLSPPLLDDVVSGTWHHLLVVNTLTGDGNALTVDGQVKAVGKHIGICCYFSLFLVFHVL